MNSPDLETNETFFFNVDTLVDFDSQTYTLMVELLVFPRIDSGENTPKNKNNLEKEDAEGGVLASQAGIAIVAAGTIATSVFGLSSLQSLWAIVNIIQLTMLLPLTLAFIPDIVVQYLIGMSFVNFNFDAIPLRDFPVIVDINFEVNEGFVSDMGLKSASTFVNHI